MEAAQTAAPMQAGPESVVPSSTRPAPAPLPQEGIFGPSQNPDVPIRAHDPSIEPPDAQAVIRILYSKRPTPWLARLLDGSR